MNNRELATFILLGVALVLMLFSSGVRSNLRGLGRNLLHPKILLPLFIFLGTCTGVVALAAHFGFWTSSLIGSTAVWLLFSGFVSFFRINDAGKDPDFFKHRLLQAVGFGAFLEFFVNLEVLPLYFELPLLLFTVFVAMLDAVAKTRTEYKAVARLTTGVLIGIGILLILVTINGLHEHWSELQPSDIRNQFLLPFWLTVGTLPCVYMVALYAGYESLILNLRIWNDRKRPSLRTLAGVAVELRGSLVDIAGFRGLPARRAVESGSFAGARSAVREFKRERDEDQAARTAARQTLADNAGVTGVDDDGLVLDRREFKETKEALEWLATCHMGWYQREDRPNKYRADLLQVLGDMVSRGLPEEHGIRMKVRRDGQAWYAYRATLSGHVFGIGAVGPPPSKWYFDGDTIPSGFPSKRHGWSDFMDETRPEWRDEPRT